MARRHLFHCVDVHVDVCGRVGRVEYLAEGQNKAAGRVLKSGKKVKELLLFAPVSTKAKLGACKKFYIRNSDAHKSKMQNIGKEQSYP